MPEKFDDELTQAFIQEGREFIEQLEPSIIELGENCQDVTCWEMMNCDHYECPRHKKKLYVPCWLHTGFVDKGRGVCALAKSKQDCLSCQVFQMTNGNNEKVNAIFRPFHSIKGTSGFLDLKAITQVTHTAENLLDLIRSGGIKFSQNHIELLCRALDFIKEAFDHVEDCLDDHALEAQANSLASNLQKAIDEARAKCCLDEESITEADTPADTIDDVGADISTDLVIEITPEMVKVFIAEADELLQQMEQGLLDLLKSPDDIGLISELFRAIHSFKGNCGFLNYKDLEELSQEMETLLEAAKSGTNINNNKTTELLLQLKDVLREAVADISENGKGKIKGLATHIEAIKRLFPQGEPKSKEGEAPPFLGEILVTDGSVSKSDMDAALAEQKRPIGEILIDKGAATPEQIEQALVKQEEVKQKQGIDRRRVKRQDMRVDVDKLDSLINMIGELVIAKNMLVNNPDLEGMELENFGKATQQMNKIVQDLQESAMVIRMIPVAGLFRRMIRLVHDLSVKSGKKVDFKLKGEETEIDKTVIELISDPLVHLIRNSVDHGLESPEERLQTNKPQLGSVTLSASHEEGKILISIEDDGKGLNKEKILAKAISKGLVEGDGSNLSEEAIFGLIFLPGFSTAEKVTSVSGRGVGMDVVKRNVEKINGKIEVKSKKGCGTKFILHIPLTMAIIEGMLVRVGNCKYIIPIMSIKQNFRPNPEAITITPDGQELVRVRKNLIPIVRLHELYNVTPDYKELHEGILIIMEAHSISICLFVDELLGQQQTVIKGLSKYIGGARGVSGCTILGNGEICLILDAGSLMEEITIKNE